MVNTTLLILLVIVNYSNFYLTHMHGKRKRPNSRLSSNPRLRKHL